MTVDDFQNITNLMIFGVCLSILIITILISYTDVFYGAIKKFHFFMLIEFSAIYIFFYSRNFLYLKFHISMIAISEILILLAILRRSKLLSIVAASIAILSMIQTTSWLMVSGLASINFIATMGVIIGVLFISDRHKPKHVERSLFLSHIRIYRIARVIRWRIRTNSSIRHRDDAWKIKVPVVSCFSVAGMTTIFIQNPITQSQDAYFFGAEGLVLLFIITALLTA